MSAFFELRIYQIAPGKMNEWVSFMEKTIMPFQVEKGMVIHGSFVMDSSDQFANYFHSSWTNVIWNN